MWQIWARHLTSMTQRHLYLIHLPQCTDQDLLSCMQDWPTGTALDCKACREHGSFSPGHTAYHSDNAAARMVLPVLLWNSPHVEWGCDTVYETVMSVRQTRGSQCGWDLNTHALSGGGNLSRVLLCQPCQQGKPGPVIRNTTNVPELNEM
jgi:hypothetical protein